MTPNFLQLVKSAVISLGGRLGYFYVFSCSGGGRESEAAGREGGRGG